MDLNKTIEGNALTVLKTLPDNYFNSCITSPPYYDLRNYHTEPQVWDGNDNCSHSWGKEIITLNSGGGWNDPEKRKNYTNQRLKNPGKEREAKVSRGQFCIGCGAWKGELGLEPKPEMYIQHLKQIFKEVYRVLRDDGTLFLNIGDAYKNKCLLQLPARFAIILTDELNFTLRNNIIWEKNVTPSSAKDSFTNNYEDIFFFSKKIKYYFEQQFEPANYDGRKDTKYKGSKKYNNATYNPDGAVNTFAKNGHERWKEIDGVKVRNMRAIWKIGTASLKDNHFAVYPQKLVERMIKAGCPEDGIILDPFIGSGTTGIVARKLNRNYIGIDLKYHELNEDRHTAELGFFR